MLRLTRISLKPLALVLAGITGACGDSLSPVPPQFTGTYALQSVNGVALPATAAIGGGQHYILIADTLRFKPDGKVSRSVAYRHISETWQPRDSIYTWNPTLDYRIKNRNLEFGSFAPCPDHASCFGTETGTITESSVTISGALMWSGAPMLKFKRIAGH